MAENKDLEVVTKDMADVVSGRIAQLTGEGTLVMPSDYSYGNALKYAMVKIAGVKDRNGKPALEVCTKKSVANALLDMVLQGLSPERTQCYFIVYGNELQMQRSYFGSVVALKRLDPNVGKIVCDIAHEGDTVRWNMTEAGERYAECIETDPMTNHDKPIAMGFCNIYSKTGELLGNTYMTYKEIETCWKHNTAYGKASTHKEFPEEMAKKTLIHRACKFLRNTALESNSAIAESFNRTTEVGFDFNDNKAPGIENTKTSTTKLSKAEEIKAKYVKQEQAPEEQEGPETFDEGLSDNDEFLFPDEVQQ